MISTIACLGFGACSRRRLDGAGLGAAKGRDIAGKGRDEVGTRC